jgi:hypothetical protein
LRLRFSIIALATFRAVLSLAGGRQPLGIGLALELEGLLQSGIEIAEQARDRLVIVEVLCVPKT